MTDVYQKLAAHLDNLPAGFPPTETGVELRILKRLFSPAEAEVAQALTMLLEPADAIAQRVEMPLDQLAPMLRDMAGKGLIVHSARKGVDLFMAAQFVIGIWEYHVNSLDEGLIKDVNEYIPTLVQSMVKHKTQQLRVIPLNKTLTADLNIMPYEDAEAIIRKQSKIVVAPCICRKEHAMVGKGCDKPGENCLIFGGGAYYYAENNMGREITHNEALEILKEGIEAGLVLQPGNSQKPLNICLCCDCCCQILKNIKALPNPAQIVNSSYFAQVDADQCTACGSCEEYCPMDAIDIEESAHINRQRCIGCGVCAAFCDVEAIALQAKPEADRWVPPANIVETYVNIAKERGKI